MKTKSVRLEHLGTGGTNADTPLVEEVEEAIRRLSQLACDEKRTGKGQIAVKITIARTGDGMVSVSHAVRITEPPKRTKALSAMVDEASGDLVSFQPDQGALPIPLQRSKLVEVAREAVGALRDAGMEVRVRVPGAPEVALGEDGGKKAAEAG